MGSHTVFSKLFLYIFTILPSKYKFELGEYNLKAKCWCVRENSDHALKPKIDNRSQNTVRVRILENRRYINAQTTARIKIRIWIMRDVLIKPLPVRYPTSGI